MIERVAIIGLSLAVGLPVAASQGPIGCRDSKTTAGLLEMLAARDWNEWSREELADTWASSLLLHECEPEDDECGQFLTCHCEWMISQDRIIGGDCECCDLFLFDVQMEGGLVTQEHLNTAVLHHTVSTKEMAEADARSFIGAMGFDDGASGHERFGEAQSVEGHYQWPTGSNGVVNGVELSLREASEGWTIFLHWARLEIPTE